ncbi:MAG: YqcI/YcgG family protein [Streptosporangiales bacterium]|nr:YqcI/YcgG family protein [Streptosporangiales bacterium]
MRSDGPHAPTQQQVLAALTEFIRSEQFSCVGAKTAVAGSSLVHRHYSALGEVSEVGRMYEDLRSFAERRVSIDAHFATFAATFDSPRRSDEVTFERLLWRQLQLLHDIDSRWFGWHRDFSPFPEAENFGFCVSGWPFFVVGMHDGASRLSRRFAYPTLVFNSHEQFELLFELGTFQRLRAETRRRELALQGSINPNLVHYPSQEVRHYAGRVADEDWRCPFQPRIRVDVADRQRELTDPTGPAGPASEGPPRPRVRFCSVGHRHRLGWPPCVATRPVPGQRPTGCVDVPRRSLRVLCHHLVE